MAEKQDTEANELSAEETARSTRRERLNELVKLVEGVAKARGWHAIVAAKDKKDYRYATVGVSRFAPGTSTEVTATYELKCDDRIRVTYEATSFHHYGLSELYDAVSDQFYRLPWVGKRPPPATKAASSPAVAALEPLFRRFHSVVRQMKHRHDGRGAFIVSDEYDVQDLLHAILRGLFDDVRPEENSPSYAGGASRMDFLLKAERVVIETKFAKWQSP